MAQFNPNDYETVEERIRRFYSDNPNGRIITENLTTLQDRQVSTWVIRAEIWVATPEGVTRSDRNNGYVLKATGMAFEIDGGKGPNATSALENGETSAIGRALANAGYSGNKRVTREEMAKVSRGVTPAPPKSLTLEELEAVAKTVVKAATKDELRALWTLHVPDLDRPLSDGATLRELIITTQTRLA